MKQCRKCKEWKPLGWRERARGGPKWQAYIAKRVARKRLKKLGRMSYAQYIKSALWIKRRTKCLKKAKYRCRICGERAVTAHHKRYPKDYRYDKVSNLVALCWECHSYKHYEYVLADIVESEWELLRALGI